jgi:uncharacterized protein (DUF1778 family)
VPDPNKTEQLQIRVSAGEKQELQRRAKAAGTSVSAWVLAKALPARADEFQRIMATLRAAPDPSYALAELSDFLHALSANEFSSTVDAPPRAMGSAFLRAYVAAMIEHAAFKKGVPVPRWALDTPALQRPYFASDMQALRLHLLTAAPPAFRRRNLFIDASVGDRV